MTGNPNAGDEVYLAKSIEEAIGGDDRTVELGVQVDVRAGRVFLRGTVATPQRKEAVAAVASDHAPDHEVVNNITVSDPGVADRAPEEETLQ